MIDRLWVRLVATLLAIELLLLPPLFIGLMLITERSHAELFTGQIRTYARLLADQFELGDGLESEARTARLLDSVILSGEGVYAELLEGPRRVRSGLMGEERLVFAGEDFEFGGHGDDTYFLAVTVQHGERRAQLRLGFDERPTRTAIASARNRILASLGAFTLLSLALALLLARLVTRPLSRLQDAARRISAGATDTELASDSRISELRELTDHLESMRRTLVGMNVKLNEEIAERAVAEREQRSLEARLRHKQNIETIGTLAGGMAHEINNVLQPILLSAENALDVLPAGSPAQPDIAQIVRSAQRARSIVEKVLIFSRAPGTEASTTVDLGGVIDDALTLLRSLFPAYIEIERQLDPSCPRVHGDPTQLHQLVMNLCTNAYQAMQATGGRLGVRLRPSRQDGTRGLPAGEYALLEVQDSGHGMDAATIERIFEPFFTTRPVGVGTGLGLSVVHGIINSMGASIAVHSEVGAGSVFSVY
ncbi:MAG: ATP-binding protein, partial [Steroidobacteraceae bacterium]